MRMNGFIVFGRLVTVAALSCVLVSFAASTVDAADKPVRLFILSGQSNMHQLDPEVSFTPAVTAAFPSDHVIVAKFASSGKLIRMWVKGWQSPDGDKVPGQGKNGRLYDETMKVVAEAMQGQSRPASISFVWMQGEADGNHPGYGAIYGKALASLLEQLQTDLGRKDIDFVLGRISDFGNDKPDERPSWLAVREAQVAFAEADPHRAWVDTDDLNGDANGLHYPRKGCEELGKRFAEAAIKLIGVREAPASKKSN